MRRFLYLILCLLMLQARVVVAQSAPRTALELNNVLVRITDSLHEKARAWGDRYHEVIDQREFHKLAPVRKDLELYIYNQIRYVKQLKDIGTSAEMRLSMLKFLEFEQDMMIRGFRPLEALNRDSGNEAINAILDQLATFTRQEQAYLNHFMQAQQAYARKHGFTIDLADNR